MKRIGIISDTHSCWDESFATHFSDCDEIWHAGDIGNANVLFQLRRVAPTVRAVRGNTDYGEVSLLCQEVEIFDVEGVKVLLTHIGGYPGHYAPGLLRMMQEKGIKLMVCGHSHILKVMWDTTNHILHINPGAAGYQGWHPKRTLVRFVIDGEEMRDLEVIELEKR